MQHSNELVESIDLVREASRVADELGNIYELVGVCGLHPEQAGRLRALSVAVHELIATKEAYVKSKVEPHSLENMLGKVRVAMIYFKKELQAPILAN